MLYIFKHRQAQERSYSIRKLDERNLVPSTTDNTSNIRLIKEHVIHVLLIVPLVGATAKRKVVVQTLF